MTEFDRLLAEADEAASSRGHGITWSRRGNTALGECACGAYVSIDTNPAPNGIDIGGSAVAVDHPEAATPERLRELAGRAYDSMERATREDGSTYVRTKDEAPGWVSAIVREAHGDMMPDDWRYDCIRDAFGAIHDSTTDDLDELSAEFADSTDIYNGDLLTWVGSNLSRAGYVDEAREEYGEPRDFFHSIQMGQYVERTEVYSAVLAGLRSVDTEYDEEEN